MRDASEAQCRRAREWLSLRLDDELSSFEGALLGAHLSRCEGCAAFAARAEGITAALRRAPLHRLTSPIALAAGRRHRLTGLTAVAAAVAAAAVLVGVSGSVGPGNLPGVSHLSKLDGYVSEDVADAHARRANLLAQEPRSWLPPGGGRRLT